MIQQSLLASTAPVARVAPVLRDYQNEAIASVESAWDAGLPAPLLVLPTGAGKTVVFSTVVDRYLAGNPGHRALIIAHRQELLQQAADKYLAFCTPRPIGFISAKAGLAEYSGQITIASKDSLGPKRMGPLIAHGQIDLLVIDEAHHASATSYRRVIEALKAVNPQLKILGVTATPERADGVGLGGVFSAVPGQPSGAAYHLKIGELIRRGHLVQPNWLAIYTGISLKGVKSSGGDYNTGQLISVFETDQTLDLIVATHLKHAAGMKAIAFTVSVNGTKDNDDLGTGGAIGLAERFNAAGVPAAYIHGQMADAERKKVLADFAAGRTEVLCNCAILTEGFDDPSVQVIHMARPTKSDVLYTQCIGRGLRLHPNKTRCLIFEYAPAATRNLADIGYLMGLPAPEQSKVDQAQKTLDQRAEALAEGEVMAAFGFNGEQIAMIGDGLGINALAIIARELDYLEASQWAGSRIDAGTSSSSIAGATIVAIGRSAQDGRHRIMAMVPAPGAEELYNLYGIWRHDHDRDAGIWEPWRVAVVMAGVNHRAATAKIEQVAQQHGDQVLAAKAMAWRNQPATDSQIKKIMRMMRRRKMPAELEGITKGQASEKISQLEADQALAEYLAVHHG